MEKIKTTACSCGAPFPMHLARFLTDHVCLCERAYKVKEGEFSLKGTEVNPFARYDAAKPKKAR